jgi:amino acid transporter
LTLTASRFARVLQAKGMKAQGFDRTSLPYYSKLNNGCFAAYYAITFISIILLFFAWNVCE